VALPEKTEPQMWPGRFLFVSIAGTAIDNDTAAFLKEVRPGGVVLKDENIIDEAQTADLVKKIKEAAGMGTGLGDLPLVAVEQEGGKINPLKLKTKDAPGAAELGKKGDAAFAKEAGHKAGAAALARGIGVLFAPVLDVIPAGVPKGEMEGRVFGSSQKTVERIGLAFADGIAEAGAIAVCKYFPGIGASKIKEGVELASLDMDTSELNKRVYPFQEAVRKNVPGIIVGHVAVPAVDALAPERLAVFSPVIVNDLLRKEDYWNYRGVVIADNMAAIKSVSTEKGVVDAMAAGCDAVLLFPANRDQVKSVCAAIQAAIDNNSLKKELLAQSMGRLDEWKIKLAAAKVEPEQKPEPVQPKAETPVAEPSATPEPPKSEPKPEEPPVKVEPVPEVKPEPVPEVKPAPEEPKPVVAPPKAEKPVKKKGKIATETYVVKKGDSANKIAVRFGITLKKFKELNKLDDAAELAVGQELIVPKQR
jgi:beta-N-acetylhexosaminidase